MKIHFSLSLSFYLSLFNILLVFSMMPSKSSAQKLDVEIDSRNSFETKFSLKHSPNKDIVKEQMQQIAELGNEGNMSQVKDTLFCSFYYSLPIFPASSKTIRAVGFSPNGNLKVNVPVWVGIASTKSNVSIRVEMTEYDIIHESNNCFSTVRNDTVIAITDFYPYEGDGHIYNISMTFLNNLLKEKVTSLCDNIKLYLSDKTNQISF